MVGREPVVPREQEGEITGRRHALESLGKFDEARMADPGTDALAQLNEPVLGWGVDFPLNDWELHLGPFGVEGVKRIAAR
jgi:hypothetical protein